MEMIASKQASFLKQILSNKEKRYRGQFGRRVICSSSGNSPRVLAANTLLLQKNYKSLVISQIKNIFCYL
jgi:hypothetical protein